MFSFCVPWSSKIGSVLSAWPSLAPFLLHSTAFAWQSASLQVFAKNKKHQHIPKLEKFNKYPCSIYVGIALCNSSHGICSFKPEVTARKRTSARDAQMEVTFLAQVLWLDFLTARFFAWMIRMAAAKSAKMETVKLTPSKIQVTSWHAEDINRVWAIGLWRMWEQCAVQWRVRVVNLARILLNSQWPPIRTAFVLTTLVVMDIRHVTIVSSRASTPCPVALMMPVMPVHSSWRKTCTATLTALSPRRRLPPCAQGALLPLQLVVSIVCNASDRAFV